LAIKPLSGLLCVASLAGVAAAPAARAESLADAIALAYKTNPTLLNQRAQLRVTDETYVQARAGFRPSVSVEVDASRQYLPAPYTDNRDAVLTLQQPLYTGGRVGTAVSAAEADILSGRETLRGTESTVLQQVVQAYADVLRDQEGVAIQQKNFDALKGILDETEARQKVGDLTRTDVAQSQGYFFQAKVDLASAKAQLEVSRSNYAVVVGERPGALEPLPPLPNVPANLNQALDTGEQANPSIRSSQYAEQAARLRTAEARDQRLPNVSVKAQLGWTGPQQFQPNPNLYAPNAVATFTVTQPLFAGGVIDSQIRQQIERQASARMQTESARRTMVQQISQAWSGYLAAHENMTNADDETKANDVAYEGVRKERSADLRSTLEVLYIEQSLRQSQLELASARHDTYVAQAGLLQAMGLLEGERLVPGIDLYDPAKNFNRVKLQGAVPWEIIPDALDHITTPALQRLPSPPKAPVQEPPAP
jgi:outer membrane protein